VKGAMRVLTEGPATVLGTLSLFHFDITSIRAIPIMIFAYHCHVQAVPIYYEMSFEPYLLPWMRRARTCLSCAAVEYLHARQQLSTDSPTASEALLQQNVDSPTQADVTNAASFSGTPPSRTVFEVRKKLYGMARVFWAAYAECTVLYLAAGIAGYILFPTDVQSNFLKSFPPDDILMQVLFSNGVYAYLHDVVDLVTSLLSHYTPPVHPPAYMHHRSRDMHAL
jgi:amino acid permease